MIATLEMPQGNGARMTEAMLSSAFRFFTTYWAELRAAVAEVFAVLLAMARNTESHAIVNIKSERRIFRPRLDVVCVNLSLLTTSFAGVVIALIYGLTPKREANPQFGTGSAERFAIFPGICSWPFLVLASTRTGAEYLLSLICGKLGLADWASLNAWRIAFGPTCLRAPFCGIGAVSLDGEWALTYKAGYCDLIWFAHRPIIPQQQNKRKYVAVTLKRLSGMGLTPRLVS